VAGQGGGGLNKWFVGVGGISQQQIKAHTLQMSAMVSSESTVRYTGRIYRTLFQRYLIFLRERPV